MGVGVPLVEDRDVKAKLGLAEDLEHLIANPLLVLDGVELLDGNVPRHPTTQLQEATPDRAVVAERRCADQEVATDPRPGRQENKVTGLISE